ncbi:MAG: nucleoside-diphosphate-sugar epimerase [Pseudohongiellaceae bacterium]|jgi:nucleoside-diphosphate-sugar epimerase
MDVAVKLFVTGGAGFLGRKICAAALSAGHEVVAMSRHPERVKGLPAGVTLVAGELTNQEQLSALFKTAHPDTVIHGAAVVTDDDPQLRPVNVGGTQALITALQAQYQTPRLALISTFAVEDIPPTAYSESKREAEELVKSSGLAHVIMRPSLIYGPGDSTNTPALVTRMQDGSHWIPAGGLTRIQPVFVEDAAAAVVTAATLSAVSGQVFRLGGPEPVSVRAYREAVRDATGGRAVVRTIPLGLMGLAAQLLATVGKTGAQQVVRFHRADHAVDIENSRRELGFSPRSLAAGLAATFSERPSAR